MTGSAAKSLGTPGKALTPFLCHRCPSVLGPVHQHIEYGTVPAFFKQFPRHLLSLFASKFQGIGKMFLITKRET